MATRLSTSSSPETCRTSGNVAAVCQPPGSADVGIDERTYVPRQGFGHDRRDALDRWAEVTSQEIKRLDPYDSVAVGTQYAGFDDRARASFRRVHALDTVDMVSVHGDAGTIPQQELDIAHDLGKPIYLGEV